MSRWLAKGLLLTLGFAGAAANGETWAAPKDSHLAVVMLDDSAPVELQSAAPGTIASLPRASVTPSAIGNPLWAIPLDDLSATRERPLFSASRRPPPPPEAIAAPPPPPTPRAAAIAPELPPFTLLGTIVGADEKIALFFDSATNTVTKTQEGDEKSGWLVRSVTQHSAIVEKDHRAVTIDLPKSNGDARPPAPLVGSLPLGVEQTL